MERAVRFPNLTSGNAHLWPKELPTFTPLPGIPSQSLAQPPDAAELPMWIELLRNARVAPDRAACPGLLSQLTNAVERDINTVIITALDSDPALRFQAAVAAHWPRDLVAGARLLARICRANAVLLAVERDAPAMFDRSLRRLAFDQSVRVIQLPNDYPQADPTLITYTLTGRRLKPGSSPALAGVIIADAPAAVAIGQWLSSGAARSSTPCALIDHRNGKTSFLMSPVGQKFAQLAEAADLRIEGSDLIVGDLLRDRVANWSEAIGNGELVLHLIQRDQSPAPSPCIRCAWCVQVCPTGVHPALLLEAAQRGDLSMSKRAGRDACIQCGVCAYACPANLPLLDGIRHFPV